jgi:drug/metabolite transporter (DMT)-like permease
MNNPALGLVIGGLLPALLFGLSGVFAKPASTTGIGLGWYLTSIGCAILLTGLALHLLQANNPFSLRGSLFAAAVGFCWALGAALVAVALSRYGMAIARIVPLYNMNTLVAVLIGLTVFAEWKEVQVLKLLAGALLITLGGRLVATA